MKSLDVIIKNLLAKDFWGTITIQIKDGKLVKADIKESIKLEN